MLMLMSMLMSMLVSMLVLMLMLVLVSFIAIHTYYVDVLPRSRLLSLDLGSSSRPGFKLSI